MHNWFQKKKKPYDQETILNDGLDFSMEFGANFCKPIQQHLAKFYPDLTHDELDEFNAICQSAIKFGHENVSAMVQKTGIETKEEEFEAVFLQKYSWINTKNLQQLFLQGMYFAWK